MVDPLPDWQYSSSSLWFNRPGFLNAPAPLLAIAQNASPPDKAAHSFLASLLNTQMFAVFEQVNFDLLNLLPDSWLPICLFRENLDTDIDVLVNNSKSVIIFLFTSSPCILC
jgi:hypothetical protein